MDACLTKPVDPQRLLEVIDATVSSDEEGRSRAPHRARDAGSATRDDAPVAPSGPIDAVALENLAKLGDNGFVGSLIEQFVIDAARLLDDLSANVAEHDVTAFRANCHALASAAANVGARGVFGLCVTWQNISPKELADRGEMHLQRLAKELDAANTALREFVVEPDEAPVRQVRATG